MIEAAVAEPSEVNTQHWRANLPHVRKALIYIKRHGHVTIDELVEWDRTHGRRLFNWEDPAAAQEWRRNEARLFLNRFRAQFEGMRVRAFIRIREDAENDIEEAGYYTVERIAEHPGMRAQVIADVTRRMASLGRELKMWKLGPTEQAELFERLRAAMEGEPHDGIGSQTP